MSRRPVLARTARPRAGPAAALLAWALAWLVGAGAVGAAGAHAWTTPGAGAGSARAATLVAPTAVTARCSTLLPSGVDVAWTAGTPAVPGTRHVVARSADGGTTWTVLATTTATSLVDQPGLLGTYRYRVTAVVGGWSRAAAAPYPARTLTLGLLCT